MGVLSFSFTEVKGRQKAINYLPQVTHLVVEPGRCTQVGIPRDAYLGRLVVQAKLLTTTFNSFLSKAVYLGKE